jgi:hypothetical protein
MGSYEEAVLLVATGRGAKLPRAGSRQHELRSIGRFLYQETRDFKVGKRTVVYYTFSCSFSPPPKEETI